MNERYVKKFLDVIILSILKNKSMCGFDIIKFIQEKFGILLSAGSIYPILHSFEKEGLLIVEKEGRMKVYSITAKGKKIFKGMLGSQKESQKLILRITK